MCRPEKKKRTQLYCACAKHATSKETNNNKAAEQIIIGYVHSVQLVLSDLQVYASACVCVCVCVNRVLQANTTS